MSPQLLQQCLGQQPDNLDLLMLCSAPEELVTESLRTAYPGCAGSPEVHTVTDATDFGFLGQRRWPLACLLLPRIKKPLLIRLLASLRDLHADRVIHLENCQTISSMDGAAASLGDCPAEDQVWTLSDSLALGFSQCDSVTDENLRLNLFEFDIRTYKPAPDWLNARHWAHPERWGKHRW